MEASIEHLTFGNLTWVLIGLLLLVLVQMLTTKKKHDKTFNYIFYFQDNLLQFIISFISSYVMFYFADTFSEGVLGLHVHGDSDYYAWFALACGFNGHVVIDKLSKPFK